MKTFKVTGYALIPVRVSVVVEAKNEEQAKQSAECLFTAKPMLLRDHIVPGTEGEESVFGFRANYAEPQ